MMSNNNRTRFFLNSLCLLIALGMFLPIVLAFFASIKTPQALSMIPPTYWPAEVSMENYQTMFHYGEGLKSYLLNSLSVAVISIMLCIVLAVPAGYGLAKYAFPFKEGIFLMLLMSMMIPYQSLLTPLYLIFDRWGLVNSYLGLAIVHTIIQLPISVYMMRNSFEAVPKEMVEAAIMDGAKPLTCLLRIILPLTLPALVTVILFAFITSWNEYLASLIFMNDESKYTMPILLTSVRSHNFGAINWGILQAGIIVSILPCIAVFSLLQKYYISGFTSGAVK